LAVLEQDPFGKSWLIMIITELIAQRALNVVSKRRMINIKTKKLHIFNEDDKLHADMLLTKRETEILSLIAQGLDSQRISEKLFISVNTVNNHRQKILNKTQTDNTSQAILYAKKMGII
ncbi:MAG TPA: LuxR C-terminal-related transcriptional regulator, partial [Bacteroidales bacterium]